MYNPNIKTTHVDKLVSSIDILPTIYNLFGIDYDSRLLMGKDIFSDSEGIVTLADRSIKTSYLEYDALKDKTTIFDKNYDYDLTKLKNDAYYKFTISSKILEANYYESLANFID
jgi:phosphoglycerol transferase MdoB-like AlkP superfamily enzyme